MDFNKELSQRIRKDFPELETKVHGRPLIYLDNAATTFKPITVIQELDRHYRFEAANIHRGVHYLSELGTEKYEATREAVRRFLNAKKTSEIIFTKGTTDGINLVAESFGRTFLKQGDEILLSQMEHHSNIVPWQLIAEKMGAKIKVIPIDEHGDIIFEEYKKLLTDKVKIVSVVYVSNALGTINPIKEMIKLAHDNGSKFMVDAAQAVTSVKIDVLDLDADFLALSAHKLFGPTGVGILYGKEALLDAIPPYQGGGDMIDKVTFEKTTYNELPHKFEAGTPAIAGFIAFKPAIEYVESIGLDNMKTITSPLLAMATAKLKTIEGLKIIGEAKNKSSVISFTMKGAHPHDLGTILDRQGIAIRTGHHCTQPLMSFFGVSATARASFSIYNTPSDIEMLYQGLIKAQELL